MVYCTKLKPKLTLYSEADYTRDVETIQKQESSVFYFSRAAISLDKPETTKYCILYKVLYSL